MLITKKRINEIDKYISSLSADANFYVALRLDNDNLHLIKKIGFRDNVSHGDTILPSIEGAVSKKNANGYYITHKDKPKERRFVTELPWELEDWGGNLHFGVNQIYRYCYPTTFIKPLEVELTYFKNEKHHLIISPMLKKSTEEIDLIKHTINLFLELAGSAEIILSDLSALKVIETRRINWAMLPPGEFPWQRLYTHLEKRIASSITKKVIFDRFNHIEKMNPTRQYVGQAGFSEYVAFEFEEHGIIILESTTLGNALYIFGKGWEEFSKMTKKEILDNNYHKARIIHSDGWKEKLRKFLKENDIEIGSRPTAAPQVAER